MSTELVTSGTLNGVNLSEITKMEINGEAITKVAIVEGSNEYTIWPLKQVVKRPKLIKAQFLYKEDTWHSITLDGYDSTIMSLYGETSGSEKRDYGFAIDLLDTNSYVWEDGTTEYQSYGWQILDAREYYFNFSNMEWTGDYYMVQLNTNLSASLKINSWVNIDKEIDLNKILLNFGDIYTLDEDSYCTIDINSGGLKQLYESHGVDITKWFNWELESSDMGQLNFYYKDNGVETYDDTFTFTWYDISGNKQGSFKINILTQ